MNRRRISCSRLARRYRDCLLALGIIVLLIAASGCRTVYESNTLNMPMMEKEGDFRGALESNIEGEGLFGEFGVGYFLRPERNNQ